MANTKELKKIFAKNLKYHLNRKGITQTDMAKDLDFPFTTVSNWSKASTYPRPDKLQQMADYFNISRSDLTEENNIHSLDFRKTDYNYFSFAISAGLPNNVEPTISNEIEKIELPDVIMGKWAGNKEIFITRINGESMNKVIPHGSLVAVKQTNIENLKDGDIVVYSDCHEYAIKRFYRNDNTLIFRPDSYDPKFTDYITSEHSEILIHGKVVLYIVELG